MISGCPFTLPFQFQVSLPLGGRAASSVLNPDRWRQGCATRSHCVGMEALPQPTLSSTLLWEAPVPEMCTQLSLEPMALGLPT